MELRNKAACLMFKTLLRGKETNTAFHKEPKIHYYHHTTHTHNVQIQFVVHYLTAGYVSLRQLCSTKPDSEIMQSHVFNGHTSTATLQFKLLFS